MEEVVAGETAVVGSAPLPPRIQVMLLVSSLEHGGAERQVIQLANGLDPERFDVCICSLSNNVPLAGDLRDRADRLRVIEKSWRFDLLVVGRVARLMRDLRTDIVHAFLFDAEMAARLAAKLAGVPVVISSERNSNYHRPLMRSLCLRLTGSWFNAMIANSHAGKHFNIRTLGIREDRIHVVHNCVDVARFHPRDAAETRRKLGVPPGQPLIGMVASFKRQKNHLMFLRVAKQVIARFPEARFIGVGERLRADGPSMRSLKSGARGHRQSCEYHGEIVRALDDLGLRDRCLFLGVRNDIVDLYNACDVTVLTSRHEGTPNVLLESMACGVPVVATDVSDNSYIVPDGRVGFLVTLDDVDAMSNRICELLDNPDRRARFSIAARAWVEREFSRAAMARKTADVYVQAYQTAAVSEARPA